MRRYILLTFVLTTVLGLARAQEPGEILGNQFLDRFTQAQVDRFAARLYPPELGRPAQEAVDLYRIRYASRDENGEMIEIIAHLYVPVREAEDALPIYILGAGTTGLSDHCAPSRERPAVSNWGDYAAHMFAYAGQGYIAVLPDPAGFNDPERVHRYFIARASGQVLLDAARAVYNFFEEIDSPLRPAEAVFMGGYSHGGNMVFAAHDLAPRYAPELPFTGVIGYGPTTDVPLMLRANAYFAPYLVYAYLEVYGEDAVDPYRILRERFANTLEDDALRLCVGGILNHYSNDPEVVYHPAFWEALRNNRLSDYDAEFAELLVMNSSGLAGSDIPALILQGTGDITVFPAWQESFAAQACAAGTPVTYVTYANVRHFQIRQFGFRDTLSWMASLAEGEEPRDDCAVLES
jgi:dienelactone hydrolase